jgi:SAM-dependent methyltransferase
VHCLACTEDVPGFETYGLPPRPGRCPRCGAKPRHRATLWYLREVVRPRLGADARVLEIGASKTALVRHPAALAPAAYLGVDTRRLSTHRALAQSGRFALMDVARLGLRAGSLDAFLCNQTLSYVRADRDALAELGRCLAPDGLLMLEVPTRGGPTVPAGALAAARPELDAAWFAENGDEWAYGEDFDARVAGTGLWPRLDRLFVDRSPGFLAEHGLKPSNLLRVVFRGAPGAARFPAPGPSDWPAGRPPGLG